MDLMQRRGLIGSKEPQEDERLPRVYRKVEWLGSQGGRSFANIKSSYCTEIGTKQLRLLFGVECDDVQTEAAILGSSTGNRYELYVKNGKIIAWGRIALISPQTSSPVSIGIHYDIQATIQDNVTDLRIFRYYSDANPYPFSGKITYLKLLDGDNTALDLIPCIRKKDQVPGFYDAIQGGFFPSASNTKFIVPTEGA